MTSDDSEVELNPPPARRVAQRALVLAAVACRGFLEEGAGDQQAEKIRADIWNWLVRLQIDQEFEPAERQVFQSPLGSLTPQERTNATWRSEGLAVLVWALQLCELPQHDQQVDPKELADKLGWLDDDAEKLIDSLSLRSSDEIHRCSELMFAIHWRLRDFRLNQSAMNFKQFAKDAWFGPLEIGGLRLLDDDLAIGHHAIAESPEDEWQCCSSIAMERHQASNWLMGEAVVYSDVETST